MNRRAFTLIELLTVVAILGVLIALTLGGVQQARAAASKIACANNLHQIAIAVHLHHDALQCLPDGGGWYGVPRSVHGSTPQTTPHQEWGLFYQILPYLDHANEWADAGTNVVIPEYQCPARRTVGLSVWGVTNCDYSGNGGLAQFDLSLPSEGAIVRKGWFPGDLDGSYPPVAVNNTSEQVAAVIARGERPPLTLEDFTSGTSGVLLAAEHTAFICGSTICSPPAGYTDGFTPGGVEWAASGVCRDGKPDSVVFGSAHAISFNACFADGSVRPIAYSTPPTTFAALCRRTPP